MPKKVFLYLGVSIIIALGLWGTSLYSYLLFHASAELFSVVVACCIFIIAWNSRDISQCYYLTFLGIAYLFVGGLDLLHTLAYKGMGVFQGYEVNLSTQLWIAARYIESGSLLTAFLLVGYKLKEKYVIISYSILTLLLLTSIFWWNIFPVCFVEGSGLTPFKKVSEYIIIFILLVSLLLLVKKRESFERNVLYLLVASVAATIASEFAFTLYIDVTGFFNLVGHYFKIFSFYLIYRAVVKTSLLRPYDLLFRELKVKEEALIAARDNLEHDINKRTEELQKSIEKLQEAELRYRIVADFTYDWEYWISANEKIEYVSPSVERITGYPAQQFYENPALRYEIIIPEDKTLWGEHYKMERLPVGPQEVQFRIRCQDGRILWIEHVCQPVTGAKGEFLGLRVSNRDITERKQALEALHESEAFLRQKEHSLVEAQRLANLGNWDWDIVADKLSWSDEVYRIFGLEPQDFGASYEAFLESIHPDDRESVKQAVNESLADPHKRYSIEHRVIRPDGSERIVHERGEVTFDKNGQAIRMIGTVHDITELKRVENALRESESALRKSQENLRFLAGKLLSVQEEERRLLAREMHDDLTQRLAILAIEAGKLEQQLQSQPKLLGDKIRKMKEQIVKISADVHDISRQLHPAIIDDLGLVNAIKSECSTFSKREGIAIRYEPKNIPDTIPHDIALCVYRIMQESLRNIAKHANVKEAEVLLAGRDNGIHLCVKDNGVGFNPATVHSKGGLGLASMEERVRLIQGELSIQSKRGQGTVVELWAPLAERLE